MFNKRIRALGQLKRGEMNKTESAYSKFLEDKKRTGDILQFWFEGIKLKIADGQCWYTPDFLVLLPSGELQLHEVKGSIHIVTDDAKVKMKVTAQNYPFRLFLCIPVTKKSGGGWSVEEYPK